MRAHNSICFYCKKLIDSLELLEIDHIIPESLPKPQLAILLEKLEKPNFEINSYFNWVPAHRGCNGPKSNHLMEEQNLRFFLELARKKEPAAKREEARFDRESLIKNALGRVRQQIESGTIEKATAIAYLEGSDEQSTSKADPWILSFSIELSAAKVPNQKFAQPGDVLLGLNGNELMPVDLPDDRALLRELESSFRPLDILTVRSEGPANNGETLSVRYAVWLLDLDRVPKDWPNRWKLMQIAPFREVYPEQDSHTLSERAAILRGRAVLVDEESEAPLAYNYCPLCSSENLKRWSKLTPREVIYFISCEDCTWTESY